MSWITEQYSSCGDGFTRYLNKNDSNGYYCCYYIRYLSPVEYDPCIVDAGDNSGFWVTQYSINIKEGDSVHFETLEEAKAYYILRYT